MLPILHQSYWRDEAFSVLLSLKPIRELIPLLVKDVHPPLYYIILHYWMQLFGDAEYITRSLSLFFHFFLALFSFFILKHLIKNWKISLIGSLAVLLNPFLLEHAFEATSYNLFALIVVVATLFYLKRKYIISSFFLALGIMTHNFGVLFLASFIIHWIYENRKSLKSKMKQFILFFSLPIIVFIGWCGVLWNQWTRLAGGYWLEPKTSTAFIDTFRVFFQGGLDYSSKAMLYNLTLSLFILALSYWLIRVSKGKKVITKNSSLFLFLSAIPLLIVYVISSFWIPIYHERYLIPILPIIIIWMVYSLSRLSKVQKSFSYLTLSLSVAYLLFAVQGSEEILRKTTKPSINWGVSQILDKAKHGDIIIPETNLNFLETKYYAQKSDKDVPVYAYAPSGTIVFYLGEILFEENEIIKEYPKDVIIWTLTSEGGHYKGITKKVD